MKLRILTGVARPALFILLSLTFGFHCIANINIKGNFKNTGKSQYVYLYKYVASEYYKIDSSKLAEGEFKFKNKDYVRGLYRLGTSAEKSFNIILSPSEPEVEVKADLADLANTIVVQGSKENELFGVFNTYNKKYSAEFAKLDQLAQPIVAIRATEPEKFNSEIKKLQAMLDSLNKQRSFYYMQFALDNKSYFASKFAIPYLIDDAATKETYFSADDFSDPELVRADILSTKMVMYLQRFSGQQLAQLQEESAYLLSLPAKGSPNKEAFYIALIKIFSPYDQDYTRFLAQAYRVEYPQSYVAKKLESELPKGAPKVGDTAPDIKLNNPGGKQISLSSLKGKIVLIDFWASWCGPCRMENPNVVKAYHKYKDKGFTILSVSLDESKDKWTQAIQKDGLLWENHISDLKGWQSSAAQLYQVRGIPATFLVGKDGKVVGTNLRGASLEDKLAELCQ